MPACESQISERLQKQLHAYALAGGAAGMGLLALSQPVTAEVVYVPTRVVVGVGGVKNFDLDLNADGLIDFTFEARLNCDTDQCFYNLFVRPGKNNGVIGYLRGSFAPQASALNRGALIDPKDKFVHPPAFMASWYYGGGGSSSHGQWANVANRYLGLAFRINGEFHFGWARLSVRDEHLKITALLTGYAYETVPKKPIRAGQTQGEPDGGSVRRENLPDWPPPSLGVLALGAPGLEAWRRNEH